MSAQYHLRFADYVMVAVVSSLWRLVCGRLQGRLPHLAQEAELALQLGHRPGQAVRVAEPLVGCRQLCSQSLCFICPCQSVTAGSVPGFSGGKAMSRSPEHVHCHLH